MLNRCKTWIIDSHVPNIAQSADMGLTTLQRVFYLAFHFHIVLHDYGSDLSFFSLRSDVCKIFVQVQVGVCRARSNTNCYNADLLHARPVIDMTLINSSAGTVICPLIAKFMLKPMAAK